jgi:hypothetical protein
MFRFVRKILFPKGERIERLLETLIEKARVFGLPETDLRNAQEMLEHFEWGLCLDILLVQLYEYSIPIDGEFLELAKEAMTEMKIDSDEYGFLNELVELRA